MNERSLLDAIWAAPDDDAPRLVYADWLLERGDAARGELIQVQCAMAREQRASNVGEAHPLRQRERELLEAHQERWLGCPFHPHVSFGFDRGFPTRRFRHSGLFLTDMTEVEQGAGFGCLMFTLEGVVISASIGASPTPETFTQMSRWFKDHDSRGAYTLTFADRKEPVIRFTITLEQGNIHHEGTLAGPRLDLSVNSEITNYRGEERYEVRPIPAFDSA